jgi:glycine/D-amino acid oxidase-like deaminating enzyme
MPSHTIVAGAGIFGVTAAIDLARRGHRVTLVDPGPIPHPLAASTDISKAVRMDYGADTDYLVMMEEALDAWRDRAAPYARFFHETGTLFLCRDAMQPGGFERESFERLVARGHRPERLDPGEIARRFPAFARGSYGDGYYNPEGGWAESGALVEALVGEARALGATVRASAPIDGVDSVGDRAVALRLAGGERLACDAAVLALGSWTPHLMPSLAEHIRSVGMPVFHLRPHDPSLFEPARFPMFGADISRTGYYGFPLHPSGVVKIANHGPGRAMHPESPYRAVTNEEEQSLRAFLRAEIPALAGAPIVHTRVCLYADTWDGHFWIARDADLVNVVVATGGSGHAFKFAPTLGALAADALEGRPNRWLPKFRHRPEARGAPNEEAARWSVSGRTS